ncbi:MAG TPA: hypothetical protein VKX17_09795 [Planctomycetota bacterium]|nr:hypothetical protein [Planctomycetota bacterium]
MNSTKLPAEGRREIQAAIPMRAGWKPALRVANGDETAGFDFLDLRACHSNTVPAGSRRSDLAA